MNPDMQCTWWPDTWFGKSITEYCIKHDLGGSDIDLMLDVAAQGGLHFVAVGGIMYVGLKFGGPVYRFYKRIKNRKPDNE